MRLRKKCFDACLFDLYDTLVYLDHVEYLRKVESVADICGVEAKQYSEAWKSLVVPSNLGRFPFTRDRVRELCRILQREISDDDVDTIAAIEHNFLRNHTHWFEGAVDTLFRLRDEKLKTGLVTNASPSVWEVIQSHGLRDLFDVIIISSLVRIRKPDVAIYAECLRQLETIPSRAAFVGDGNDRELEGAKQAGLATILVKHDGFRANISEQSSSRSIDFVATTLAEIPTFLLSEG